MATTSADTHHLSTRREPGRGWQIAFGVLLIVSGFVAVLMPAIAALATALVFAWVLVLSGAWEIAYAFLTRSREGFGWKLASALLTLALGIALLVMPQAGVASLALLVGGFLFVSGLSRFILAWRMRPRRGWGWVMFDGLLTIALSILIIVGWPPNSLAVIGLLTGFALISSGVWRIALAPARAT
ncbi:MAG: hypothetical protein JWP22_4251 [Ramlibacter sp.]|jgi:uncharacterized membrane protein HdeD (DUF308 family)|nr:hypothetical protein [Ramlibacter sp.]